MTLYDEYRKAHPIAAEPSEFRDIIEAEVKRALEWMRGRDKPLPAEDIKPGRYKVTRQVTYDCNIRQGESGELWVRRVNYPGVSVGWSMPLGFLINSGATFQAVGEVKE